MILFFWKFDIRDIWTLIWYVLMTLLKNPNIEAKLYTADEIDISSTLYNSQKIWLPIWFPSHYLFITWYNFSFPYYSFLYNINFSCMCKQSWGLEWNTAKLGKTWVANIISITQSLVCYVHKILKTLISKYILNFGHITYQVGMVSNTKDLTNDGWVSVFSWVQV